MIHVRNPHSGDKFTRELVHALAYETAQASLCGMAHMYRVSDGERFQSLFPTTRPITCKSCFKALEVSARVELGKMSPTDLEELIDIMQKMRAA